MAKQFNWKFKGKMGGWALRFNFGNETEGEAWFDTVFSVWNAKPGSIWLGKSVLFGGRLGSFHSAILHSLKEGREMWITPILIKPRGEVHYPIQKIIITKAELVNDGNNILVEYK